MALRSARLVDAHMHPARLSTLTPAWHDWARRFGSPATAALYDRDGTVVPERFHEFLESEGVDVAIVLCEYSPKVTGIQPAEDLVPLVQYDPARVRMLANLNPHLHFPLIDELERQLELGAIGLKLHPVHGGFPPNERALYRVYSYCEQQELPVVFHCGTSIFPGSTNRFAVPSFIDEVAHDFPELTIVLAHGGRGWWYDAAAFLALTQPNVWIELSGLPPRKVPVYYAKFDLSRLAKKLIFGTDWPGVPGVRENAEAIAELELAREEIELILHANARRVFRLDAPSS